MENVFWASDCIFLLAINIKPLFCRWNTQANNHGARRARVWPVRGFRLNAFRVPDPRPPTWLRETLLSRESQVDEKRQTIQAPPTDPSRPSVQRASRCVRLFPFHVRVPELPRASNGRPSGRLDVPTVPILRPQVVAGSGKPFLHLRGKILRIDRSFL